MTQKPARRGGGGRIIAVVILLILAVILGVFLAGQLQNLPFLAGRINPLPTPIPGEEVGHASRGTAARSAEETWSRYLRDTIAEQNENAASRVDLIERYADPALAQENLAGTMLSMELVEDRSVFNITQERVATSNVEFDVRLELANGDRDTRTCHFNIEIDLADDGFWYVLNPQPLAVFTYCASG